VVRDKLVNRYRFHEAVPFFQEPISAIPLPEFYLALGRTFGEIPDLRQAEVAFRKGLALVRDGTDQKTKSCLLNQLGFVLLGKGDLEGALTSSQQALASDEKAFGQDNPAVTTDANDIGLVLRQKGDLEGALRYTKRALEINERFYGAYHPAVATKALNIGQILLIKGDLENRST
jgi:tetratricopeptide (TPR) repeat protein